jgi:hypothetical protein
MPGRTRLRDVFLRPVIASGLVLVVPLAAASMWRVSEGEVRVVCPLTVGGSFDARTTAISGALASGDEGVTGSIAVDLRTLDTGIGLRNSHMRDRYLEVQRGERFERAVLSELRLAAPDVVSTGGETAFTATLLVHGVSRPVTGAAQLSPRGAAMRVQASFPLSLAEFEIPSPRYLGVGVRDRVTVHVSFVAIPSS